MIVNDERKLLLFQYKEEHKPAPFWATSGAPRVIKCNSLILTVYQTNLSAIKVYQDAGFDVISSQNGEIQMAFVMRT